MGSRPLVARGCLHDDPSREGAAQWHMNAALHNAVWCWVYSSMAVPQHVCVSNCTTQDWSFNRECLLKSLLFWDRLKLTCLQN